MFQPSRLLLVLAVALLTFSPSQSHSPRRQTEPRFAGPSIVLWAWERPEDLRFIAGRAIGVAYLAKTFYVGNDGYAERPRMQPLDVVPGTWMMAVARIEARPGPLAWDAQRLDQLADRIAALAETDGVRALQVDFDATASQRTFYGQLLRRLRERLPKGVPLSITALVSWCVEDDWIRTLPMDEAVPMLFRMGTGTTGAKEYLRTHGDLGGTTCGGSIGSATDERWPGLPEAPRRYLFSERLWTESRLREQMEALR